MTILSAYGLALRKEAAIAALDVAQAAYAAAFGRLADVVENEDTRAVMFRVEKDIHAISAALRSTEKP